MRSGGNAADESGRSCREDPGEGKIKIVSGLRGLQADLSGRRDLMGYSLSIL